MATTVPLRARAALIAVLLGTLVTAVVLAQQRYDSQAPVYKISGRIVDPHRVWSDGAVLTLVGRADNSYSMRPVVLTSKKSFVTPPVPAGIYVLEVTRKQEDTQHEPRVIGSTIVEVTSRDVSGVVVELRRDTAITGVFRMESDNPKAVWPTSISVAAYMALGGAPLFVATGADGAPGGKFVLRNAFGPRVLRCGYHRATGSRWWPSRVMLDGNDITNVPTDFSEHENGQLEVYFTQHPSRISGIVILPEGQPVRAPWILVSSADHALWQEWASTNDARQGDTEGRFSVPVLPGTYFIRAMPQNIFDSSGEARRHVLRFTPGSITVDVQERDIKSINLTLRP